MPGNHVLLETIAVTQNVSSVLFNNLPSSGYTDLKLVISARLTENAPYGSTYFKINGSYVGNVKWIQGSGSAANSSSDTNMTTVLLTGNTATAGIFSNTEVYIPNYLGSNNKSYSVDTINETNGVTCYSRLATGLYASTAAITTLEVAAQSTDLFMPYSTFSLYGVAATGTTPATAPKATGGNIVATDGTYWYHAFTTSGNFIPQTPITCDAIVVGAGGGGGSDVGGGGGAGRVYALSTLSLTQSTNYTCTVGAGGTRGSNPSAGIKGSDSTFTGGGLSYLALGGGGGNGRSYGVRAPNDGWNGGGGGYDSAFGATAGNGGNAGGATTNPGSNPTYCGGGGGAAEAGNTDGTGQGGDGTTTYASWLTAINSGVSNGSTLLIAGGGGGGMYGSSTSNAIGGDGGGGLGGDNDQGGGDGTAATGSGGGGGGSSQNGGAGGSGLIIIRYLVA